MSGKSPEEITQEDIEKVFEELLERMEEGDYESIDPEEYTK